MTKNIKTNQTTPSLRFSGFSDLWEEKELGDIATFLKGKGISKDDVSTIGDYKCIRYGELYTDYKELIKIVKSRTNTSPKESLLSQENDLLIPASGETAIDIATASCIDESDVLLGGDLNIIRLGNEQSGHFFAYGLSHHYKRDIAKLAQGNAVVHLYASQLKKVKVIAPSFQEQKKIASFLSTVDSWLDNLRSQKTALESYKKSMMQKIFSQEIRFRDENGKDYPEWEEKKINEIFTVTRGNVLAVKNMKKYPTDKAIFPVYSSQTLRSGLIGYYDRFLYENSLTWTTDGANAGEVNYRDGKFYCTNVCGVLISDNGYANQFVAERLNSVTRRYVSYVGNPKLMNNVISQIKITLPPIAEQQKISDLFNLIDKILESKQHQITEVENWKKGLLRRMFV